MRVFAISGYSGSGKTMLIEALVKELKKRGYSVATVKNSKEDDEDTKSSDTWRQREAGAEATALLGPETTVVRSYIRIPLNEVFHGRNYDFVLVEGLKRTRLPRFWCTSTSAEEASLPEGVMAVIVWEKFAKSKAKDSIPVLTLKDIGKLADIIEADSVPLANFAV